jgi:pilus assembly protein CpaE
MSNRTISLWSPVSGTGTTFTAVNLAYELSRRGARVVLVDFDLKNPSIGLYFKSQDIIHNLDNVVPFTDGGNLTEKIMESNIQTFEETLSVLYGTNSPEQALYVRQEPLAAVLAVLKEMYDFVVLDTHSSIDNAGTYQALVQSDTIYMVVDKNVFSIRQYDHVKTIFESNFDRTRVKLIINKTSPDIYMGGEDIENYLGISGSYELPWLTNSFINAINQGKWFEFVQKDKLAKEYRKNLDAIIMTEFGLTASPVVRKSKLKLFGG